MAPHVNICIEGGWSHFCVLPQIIYLANAGPSSLVNAVHNFSIHLLTNLTHQLTHEAAARTSRMLSSCSI